MNRHEHIGTMLVRQDELTLQEQTELHDHLRVCPDCRQMQREFAEDEQALSPLFRNRAPATLRTAVLAEATGRDGHHAGSERSRRPAVGRRTWLVGPIRVWRAVFQGAGVIVLVATVSWFSTPLGSTIASTFRATFPAPGSGPYASVCRGAPWVMLSPGMRVMAPRYFQTSGGRLNPEALAIARRAMPRAQYWAIYGYETRVGLCRPGIARDIVVGLNPSAGTELVAVDVEPRTS